MTSWLLVYSLLSFYGKNTEPVEENEEVRVFPDTADRRGACQVRWDELNAAGG